MNDKPADIYSRVLVLDEDATACATLKQFFEQNNLVGVRQSVDALLGRGPARMDLGGAVIAEDFGGPGQGLELALGLHERVRELPIFIRREQVGEPGWSEAQRRAIAGHFQLDEIDGLQKLVNQYLFDTEYPLELVRLMEETTEQALASSFRDLMIDPDIPCLVKEKMTSGTMVGLMPVEADWCRGYMMIQSTHSALKPLVAAGHTGLARHETDFRDVMGLLGEVCNLVWGGLKSRLLSSDGSDDSLVRRLQVPLMVTQTHEEMPFFLSFGTDRAQLCFRYTLRDTEGQLEPAVIHQSFIFNINWSPERFRAREPVEELVESGELELL